MGSSSSRHIKGIKRPSSWCNKTSSSKGSMIFVSPKGSNVDMNNSNKGYTVPYPQSQLDLNDFKVSKIKATMDKKLTSIDEKSAAVLKYRTPHFRATATVDIPALEDNRSIQVGWIQTCTHMEFINNYMSEGITSWEFPEIVSGKYSMISDADGKQYPWYGSKHEVVTIKGSTSPQQVTVHMNDNFFPQVTWYIPHNSFDKTPRLTHIHRRQRFYTFLVVKDTNTDQLHVLRTITWSMVLNIGVNPASPLGKRAKLLGPFEQETPEILAENHVPLEKYALKQPNANNSQALIWRPSSGEPKVIVPPVETTVDMEKYLISTREVGRRHALAPCPRLITSP